MIRAVCNENLNMIFSSSHGIFQYCGAAKNRTKSKKGTSLQSLFWRSTNSRMVDPAWKAHPPSNYPMLGPTPGPGGLQTSFCRTLWDLLQLGEGAISHQKSGPRTRPWCSGLPTFARGPAHNVLHRFRRLRSGGASYASYALIFPSSALPAIYLRQRSLPGILMVAT